MTTSHSWQTIEKDVRRRIVDGIWQPGELIPTEKQLLNAKQTYAEYVRKNWRRLPGLSWQVVSLSVELELQSDPKQEPTWHPVQLLYVRALKENGADGSRKDWALFLSTDDQLSAETLLQI